MPGFKADSAKDGPRAGKAGFVRAAAAPPELIGEPWGPLGSRPGAWAMALCPAPQGMSESGRSKCDRAGRNGNGRQDSDVGRRPGVEVGIRR